MAYFKALFVLAALAAVAYAAEEQAREKKAVVYTAGVDDGQWAPGKYEGVSAYAAYPAAVAAYAPAAYHHVAAVPAVKSAYVSTVGAVPAVAAAYPYSAYPYAAAAYHAYPYAAYKSVVY